MHEAGVEGVHFLSSLTGLDWLVGRVPSHKWLGYFQKETLDRDNWLGYFREKGHRIVRECLPCSFVA